MLAGDSVPDWTKACEGILNAVPAESSFECEGIDAIWSLLPSEYMPEASLKHRLMERMKLEG